MYKYTQIKKIGAGSFGAAILCKANSTGERYVIKKVDVRELNDDERKAAKREASILSALHHPSIITHIESFEEDGYLCLVTEYAEKGDLSNKLEERKGTLIPEDQILDWFIQMALAMLYLHKKKILHRDLKLQNVFLSADNMIKLGDFGIARVLKHTMECAKTVVGTPYYLSPEICENKPYNHKSDVWSAGCILYELCVQKHAFEANSITALVRKILRGQYDDIPSVYSSNVRTLINVMLQQKPSARPAFLTILQQPFLQPYIHSFTRRCAAKGVTVPYADQLIQLIAANTNTNGSSSSSSSSSTPNVPVSLPPTTRSILQQNNHYASSSSSSSTNATATTSSSGNSSKNVPSSSQPAVSGKGSASPVVPLVVPEEGSPVRPVVLPKVRDGIFGNNNNNINNNVNNVRPPVIASRANGGIPLVPNNNYNQPTKSDNTPYTTTPVSRSSREDDRPDYQPSKYKANVNQHPSPSVIPRMVPITEVESLSSNNSNNIQVRQSIHPTSSSQLIRPPSASYLPVSSTGTTSSSNTSNKPRQFVHDGKAYPLPASVVKNGVVPLPTSSTASTTASTGDPKWATPVVVSTREEKESMVINSNRKPDRYEGKEDSTTNSTPRRSINDSTNDNHPRTNPSRYRSSILADPLFQAPVVKPERSSNASKIITGSKSATNEPVPINGSAKGSRQEAVNPRPLSRDTKTLSSQTENEDNDNKPSRSNTDSNYNPSRKGRHSSYSRDSDASLSNEDLLAEADELLPYGLPLEAYKIKDTENIMLDKASTGLSSKQLKGMRIAAVTNENEIDQRSNRNPTEKGTTATDSKQTETDVPTPALTFTLVPAHLTRRKVAGRHGGTILPGGIHRKEKDSSSSTNSGTDNLSSPTPMLKDPSNPDKLLLNGNTLKLPGVTNSKDSLTYRIECLRVFLGSIMGDEAFTKLYRSLTEGRGLNVSVDLSKTVRHALGKERKGLLPLVFQLIYLEEQAYQGR